VDVGRDCRPVYEELLRRGVIVRTGDIFGMPTHLRVTIGTPAENERFLRELKSILMRDA
jgi:histidinol-phosphate aminotransferase